MKHACLALGLALGLAVLGSTSGGTAKGRAFAKLSLLNGGAAGTASFEATAHGVLIVLDLKGLTPGVHGVHIHAIGNCDLKTAFASAGPHFSDESDRMHGYLAEHGPHAGDLPNQFAAADGTLHASVLSNGFTLGKGMKSLFDTDGAAIVIDEKGDDYVSQPDGNSGAPIACGVIERIAQPDARKGGTRRAHK